MVGDTLTYIDDGKTTCKIFFDVEKAEYIVFGRRSTDKPSKELTLGVTTINCKKDDKHTRTSSYQAYQETGKDTEQGT